MTKEEEERARKDAEEKAKLDAAGGDDKMQKLLDGIAGISQACDSIRGEMDAMKGRMDAMEGGTADPAADKARKDAEEKEAEEKAKKDTDEKAEKEKAEKDRKDAEEKAEKEEKDRKDAATRTGDSVTAARLAAVEAAIKPRADAEQNQIADAWAKANAVMMALGDSTGASAAMPGEGLTAYRRRILLPMQTHSGAWKSIDLAKLDESTLEVAETQIRMDAMLAAKNPSSAGRTGLRMITERTETGHTINTFVGHPASWMNPLAGPQRNYVKRWNLGNRSAN